MNIEVGAHVCHLFDGFSEQKAVALPFLLEGLRQGEACLYITGRQPVDDWLFELQASGVDVQRELRSSALAVMPGAVYRNPSEFNSIVKARELLAFVEERLQDFRGVRIAGDVAWEWDPPLPPDKVCHWEATANLAFENSEVRTICQYDCRADSPTLLDSALRTHPLVILGEHLYTSPFYEASRILENEPWLNQSQADASLVGSMLDHLRSSPNLLLR